jgi:hypothetical protein
MVAYAYQCARIITWDRAAGFNNHATFQVLAFLMGTQGDKRGIDSCRRSQFAASCEAKLSPWKGFTIEGRDIVRQSSVNEK